MIKTYKKGSIIVKQGEDNNKTIFIIVRGKCAVQRAVNNNVIDCGIIREGDIFGEISMILNVERAATIIAKDDEVIVEELNKFDFLEKITKNPEIAWKVLTNLAMKTQMLDEIQEQISDPVVLKKLLTGKL